MSVAFQSPGNIDRVSRSLCGEGRAAFFLPDGRSELEGISAARAG
jgi:hypothetical protein